MRRALRLIVRALLAIVAAVLLVWAVDDVRLRMMGSNSRFGSVVVQKYYAVALKNRKTEYMFDEPHSQTCVHSMFPHFGDAPCWYLETHRRQRVDVGSNPSDFWRLP